MNDANISEVIKAKNYCGEFIELFFCNRKLSALPTTQFPLQTIIRG